MKRLVILVMMGCSIWPALIQAQKVKVLTYNIHHGGNMKGALDLQGIANVILATNPDLVALQEVDSVTGRTKRSDQLKELASLTGMYTYFAKAMDYDGGGYGTGILSKLPIKHSARISLPVSDGHEPRVAGITTIQLPGDSLLQFISAHLDAEDDPANRIEQANALVQHFANSRVPAILAGDFNAPPDAREIGILKQLFADATHQLGPTFPSDTPSVRLDYIMTFPKQHWNITRAYVLEETVASDHRPVVCELEIKH